MKRLRINKKGSEGMRLISFYFFRSPLCWPICYVSLLISFSISTFALSQTISVNHGKIWAGSAGVLILFFAYYYVYFFPLSIEKIHESKQPLKTTINLTWHITRKHSTSYNACDRLRTTTMLDSLSLSLFYRHGDFSFHFS